MKHINRFVRLDYGDDLDQRGVLKEDIPDHVLDAERQLFCDPRRYAEFRRYVKIGERLPNGEFNGGADNLCAVIAGLPVSYFRDVVCNGGPSNFFPQPEIAISSPVGNQGDAKPIGGVEEPESMPYSRRSDYVSHVGPMSHDRFFHYNHLDSGAWNSLEVIFLPARYDDEDEKCRNAYLETKVNGAIVFKGEVKSGTRSSRRYLRNGSAVDPEKDVYVEEKGDMKIRLLGHWGSKVYYRNIKIRSVGSE